MTLYELTDQMMEFLKLLENNELSDEEIARGVEEIKLPLEEKADDIASLIKELNAEADAIKAERDSLNARMKQKQDKADWLKQYLSDQLSKMGIEKLETARNKITFRASAQVKIYDEEAFRGLDIAENFFRYKAPEIDKTKLKEALKNGAAIEGVELVTNKSIQIK